MGTRFAVVVEGPDRAREAELGERALREVERMSALLDTWGRGGPLNLLRATPPGAWAEVDPELAALLTEAVDWSDRTGGAFESRVGALIDVWDLRGVGRVPGPHQLAAALAVSGPAGVILGGNRLARTAVDAWIDTGGFGKGAALRAAATRLTESRPHVPVRVLMDLGGQILALAPADDPWTVAVAHPNHRSEALLTLRVHDHSVSTSGTSERGTHILDPRTGHPVPPWGSVTVVDVDPLAADVLSTALYVLGPQEGPAWAREADIAALFLESVGGEVQARWTPAMEPLFTIPLPE